MGALTEYIVPRIGVYILTIHLGVTLCFLIPRFTPLDPILTVINRFSEYGAYYDPESVEAFIESMKELYGLKGNLLEQYVTFLRRLITGDFGPSLIYFPTPAISIYLRSLPWTIGLLLISTLISWLFGNLLGGLAGYFNEKRWAKALGVFATVVYPIPYYIMALVLVMLFAYAIHLFPFYGAYSVLVTPSFTLEFIANYLYHSFLPALSLVIVGYGWWFLSMRALVINVKTEDYVQFAKATGMHPRKLLFHYVIRNSLLPQVTGLSISLGGIFSGAMMTEVAFSYPGVGWILFESVLNGDFNLMMACVTFSIVAVATAALILDLLYPLVDPRIRYR
jgi:peptide/nickel transport system permease protein